MESCFYDAEVCRRFNMLGNYINYYETAIKRIKDTAPESDDIPADCLGHVKEPTKGSESDASSVSDESVDEEPLPEPENTISTNEAKLLCKLKEAEYTITALQEHLNSMNKDHFDVEQALKKTYYEDRKRDQQECHRLQNELIDKHQQIVELARKNELNTKFWDDRQREINNLMNDVILNVKDMYRYQELCNIFSPK
ncbi:hypothetical protein BBOV_II005200 [Babesia bovis T2Bo]|uniref:Uncharacterized protein n=1 Tax=Babesia bovis TaxID=5865 RepID=A7AU61_BABBO|nr:hypothetical protein BBOV_II005200 [Babesia bovis T2Bo]EDO06472.1 hypothetical protein BBOV_II005200 [Babesia bovis T2Bo]|eukprot:XP_001610040.1 hypothetical protein [Babesia bovis T2Bo]